VTMKRVPPPGLSGKEGKGIMRFFSKTRNREGDCIMINKTEGGGERFYKDFIGGRWGGGGMWALRPGGI